MSVELMLLPVICMYLLVLVAQAAKLRKLSNEMQQQGNTLSELKQEMAALLSCERGMGERIKQQQQQVRCVIDRQDKQEISNSTNSSYKQAMVLLQKGVSTDDLIEACELSRGELDLLSRMEIAAKPILTAQAA